MLQIADLKSEYVERFTFYNGIITTDKSVHVVLFHNR